MYMSNQTQILRWTSVRPRLLVREGALVAEGVVLHDMS